MEYYSKLNMEVEKSKIHTEWKIKRLQLDQTRIQLLSTEERNLKREKLELEHQCNEVMAMSIQSDFKSDDDFDNVDNNNGNTSTADSTPSADISEGQSVVSEFSRNKAKTQNSSDVFSAICNVAKSIFGVSTSKEGSPCDNEVEMDNQGNVVKANTENKLETKEETSNDVIGANLDNAIDNLRFLENKQEALRNRQKVMAHEFGQLDTENNQTKDPLLNINIQSLDEENNKEEWTPNAEARRNKLKVLGAEFDIIKEKSNKDVVVEPRTEAQKEALKNKLKVLGVEYNLPLQNTVIKEPANTAQEEALRNRDKVLGSEYAISIKSAEKFDSAKKSGLRLNLKPYSETSVVKTASVTPNAGAITPGDLFPQVRDTITIF